MDGSIRASIDQMPWLVRWCIADYLDYASWFQLQSAFPQYKDHPPKHLKFDGSYAYESAWDPTKLNRAVRFGRITEDDFYGGIVRPIGSIGVLLQMIKFSRRIFHNLTVLDISKQIVNRYQVSELFSSSTVSVFRNVKSISLRISLTSVNYFREPEPTIPPPNLECVTLNLMHWRGTDYSVFNSIVPLLMEAKMLSFIMDVPCEVFPIFDGRGPFENIVELEVNDRNMSILANSYVSIRESFPRLKKIAFNYDCCALTFDARDNFDSPISKPLVWCSHSPDLYGEFDSVTGIRFIGQEVINDSTISQCVNATVFSWPMPGWDCVWLNFLSNILQLKSLKFLNEVRLPRQLFMAWSKFACFRFDCRMFAQTCCTFPSVKSLHFIPGFPRGCVSYFSAPTIPQGEIADEILRHMFDIFPNVKVLSIAPVPLLEGGEVFRYLTTSTKLTTLMILHTRRIQCGTLDGRLNFFEWLPGSGTLDAFLFYSDQLLWSNEVEERGLLDCLKKNASLRYVCIICDVANSVGRIGLSARMVEEIGSIWYNVQRGGSQGRYLVFVFLHCGRFSCLAVKPKTKKCRKPYTFERNYFSTWQDLECAYPELYSVFWRHLSLHIDFRERVTNI